MTGGERRTRVEVRAGSDARCWVRLPQRTTRGGADKVQVYHNASGVLGAGLSALDAASERGSETDAGAHGGGLEAAKEDRQTLGGRTSLCSATPSPSFTVQADSDFAGCKERDTLENQFVVY